MADRKGKMEDMVDFTLYEGKKIFLTGHTGFKGSWMLAWLNKLGAIVRGYSLKPENEIDLYNTIKGDTLCHSVNGDIRDKNKIEMEILSFQPDFIFHLAAQPLVRRSYEIPSETFEVNAIGTAFLLDAVRKLKNKCVVILITTDKVYENREWHYPYRENDRLGGVDPYSASKACTELVVDSYRNSYFNLATISEHKKSIATARAGNVIGGGDWSKDRIIPDIIRSISLSKPIELRNPKSIRPWQHVLDPINGYLTLGVKMFENPNLYNTSWNFGPYPNDTITVFELANRAIEIWGHGDVIKTKDLKHPHEASLLKLDISKTMSQLGWKPIWDSYFAIEKTISWYKHYLEKNENIIFNQINQYCNYDGN